jgi:hypothetical protein
MITNMSDKDYITIFELVCVLVVAVTLMIFQHIYITFMSVIITFVSLSLVSKNKKGRKILWKKVRT